MVKLGCGLNALETGYQASERSASFGLARLLKLYPECILQSERIVSTQVTFIFWRSFPLLNKRSVLEIARAATVLVAIFVTEPGGEVLGGGEFRVVALGQCAQLRGPETPEHRPDFGLVS